MKHAWQDDPEVVEEAMRLAKSAAFDDVDYFDDDHLTLKARGDDGEGEDDSNGEMDNEGAAELDAEYVKENFDHLHVKKIVR